MRRWAVFILLLILTGCSTYAPSESAEHIDDVGGAINEQMYAFSFPSKVSAVYSNVSTLLNWEYDSPQDSWELVESFEGGAVDHAIMKVDVYKNNNDLHAYATVNDAKNLQMFVGYDAEGISFLPLDVQVIDDEGHVRYLLGCIYSTQLPGRCLEYAPELDEWFGFSVWGEPSTIDFDQNENATLVFWFHGKGNNFPDASLVRWNGETWEHTSIQSSIAGQLKDVSGEVNQRLSVRPYEEECFRPGDICFAVVDVRTEQDAIYKLNGGNILLRIKPTDDTSPEDAEQLNHKLSLVEMFAEMKHLQEKEITKQALGQWLEAMDDMRVVAKQYGDTKIGKWTAEFLEMWQQFDEADTTENYEKLMNQAEHFLERIQD